MDKPITVLKFAKFIRGMMQDVEEGNMFLVLDFRNGKMFLRKAEFHG